MDSDRELEEDLAQRTRKLQQMEENVADAVTMRDLFTIYLVAAGSLLASKLLKWLILPCHDRR
ncbi:phage-shock protein [Anopheles sinensis]|uniref:Phage-shock protein n=1 Tax=Anopheles sinensis TaxID=74873 RepID=A0A084WK26_ANOSI|nr:phage-shock protein [Anopheles sinensis]